MATAPVYPSEVRIKASPEDHPLSMSLWGRAIVDAIIQTDTKGPTECHAAVSTLMLRRLLDIKYPQTMVSTVGLTLD
ncbi:hypothetical protein PC116_g12330 [Phytophthora cactorum]|uniref:Uncharacterized protein n=1 Tax=Phytophthora cactorum TaxID=29920 RepID=A0A8T1KS91_9STRA|nr:hypothetical protein Pcac1_g27184 [Phytophthora cactorum]KAG2908444.1 hypothetical protein PC114_g10475 [Phytophthora cactorum]KAG2938589.1 hypothetical protein PC117_g11134 [Phytophthora cactorum]KAG3016043.1 hypothetical protein PC119_g11500 [Phytophthora cactorum]KAG3016323.1 hypothetical protein PC120_g11675 [Phytophthora cactorum]